MADGHHMKTAPSLTGRERHFGVDELIVSKTDQTGRITYANDVFLRVAGYTEDEVIGRPHNLIRHPDMPRSVFKLLWDTIESGEEIFAYVVNRTKDGDHYWVLAHVTPSYGLDGSITGYHSNRRVPDRGAVETASALYADLRAVEASVDHPVESINAGVERLVSILTDAGITYSQWVWSLTTAEVPA